MRTLSVIAQNATDGLYYPGYVNYSSPENETTSVHFYSLKSQEIQQENVIVVGGASPCPNLQTGDHVLVQVQYKTTWAVLYVPGMVIAPPTSRDHDTKNFLVRTYTNVLVERARRFLVKVGKAKHDEILAYVNELNPRRNPLYRSEPCLGGSVLRRRKLPKAVPIYSASFQKSWKEIQFALKRRSASYKKLKARQLLSATLHSGSPGFKASSEKRLFIRRGTQNTTSNNDNRMQFLKDVVTSAETNVEQPTATNINPVQTNTNQGHKENENTIKFKHKNKSAQKEKDNIIKNKTNKSAQREDDNVIKNKNKNDNHVQREEVKLVLEDLEGDHCDVKEVKAGDKKQSENSDKDGTVSPDYTKDTFESSDNEVSNRTDTTTTTSWSSEKQRKRSPKTSMVTSTSQKSLISDSRRTRSTSIRLSNQSLNRSSQNSSLPTSPSMISESKTKSKTSYKRGSKGSGVYSHVTNEKTRDKSQRSNKHSGTLTPVNKQDGSDANSDVTISTNRTYTNDVISQGEEVLARWSDDGWYYFGRIVTEVDDNTYVVKDATGYTETINRRDILSDSEQPFQVLQPDDSVIALHPSYVFSYAPARVIGVYRSTGVSVQFFDKTETRLPMTEAYKISREKYEKDVNYIWECENRLCRSQLGAVARDDRSGCYIQCTVECKANTNQHFFIRLPDMTFARQSAIHIFTFQPHDHKQEQVLKFVLAPVDPTSSVYLPGCVTQYKPFCVRFCDGRISRELRPQQCLYLNQDYYTNAVNYFLHIQTKQSAREDTNYEDRTSSQWQLRNSDSSSDISFQNRVKYASHRKESSSVTNGNGPYMADKRSSISKNLVYNPNVLEYRRNFKLRYVSTRNNRHQEQQQRE